MSFVICFGWYGKARGGFFAQIRMTRHVQLYKKSIPSRRISNHGPWILGEGGDEFPLLFKP